MSYFVYNGRSSEEFGLRIESKNIFSAPEFDAEFTSIPGRSGDLIVSNNCFKNVEVITFQTIITAAAVISAVGVLLGLILKVHKWYLKQEKQDEEIRRIKEENALLCYGISACLDGLIQLGANHTVPLAKEKLDNYLNQTAHGQRTNGGKSNEKY